MLVTFTHRSAAVALRARGTRPELALYPGEDTSALRTGDKSTKGGPGSGVYFHVVYDKPALTRGFDVYSSALQVTRHNRRAARLAPCRNGTCDLGWCRVATQMGRGAAAA